MKIVEFFAAVWLKVNVVPISTERQNAYHFTYYVLYSDVVSRASLINT